MALLGCVITMTSKADSPVPKAIVPHVGENAPVVDGTIHEDEYTSCSSLTGMITMGDHSGTMVTAVPKMQQVTWYLGYDDNYFYMAMRSPNPPGSWPKAQTKANDFGNQILWDDHVEIQISKDRTKATFYGIGFYKIMANAKGFKNDDWYYNSTPGTESEWDILGPLKSGVTEKYWDLELAIDLRAFDVRSLDDLTWVLQLLRADSPGGIYFAGWVGKSWMNWPDFGEVTFSRSAPVLRFLNTGELVTGNMDLEFELSGQTENEVSVEITVEVIDGNGKTLFSKTETSTTIEGSLEKIQFEQTLPFTDRDNLVNIHAKYRVLGQLGEADQWVTLYQANIPVHKMTEDYTKTHVTPWLKSKPEGDIVWDFAYWPSYGVMESSIDVDFFGISEAKAKATSFEVKIFDEDNTLLAEASATLSNKTADLIVQGVDLNEGNYHAEMTLYGEDGESIIGQQKNAFIRKKFEWEGTTLGLSDRVTQPYTPIVADVKNRTFSVTLRDYVFNEEGLFDRIDAAGGRRKNSLLRNPIILEGIQNGNAIQLKSDSFSVDRVVPGRVEMTSIGKLGSIDYTLDAYLEYDGYYRVKLNLSGDNPSDEIDSLQLTIPLWDGVDTLYMQRANDKRGTGKYGNVPEGDGVVWSSDELIPYEDWKSFCPIVFLGNGDKGVWWFAEENRDWVMNEQTPVVQVVRTKDGYDLVITLIAETAGFEKAREFEFAFLVDPVRKTPNERSWAWGKTPYQHNTFGFRYWGDSVDGFAMSDESLVGLKALFTSPEWSMSEEHKANKRAHYSPYFRDKYYNTVGNEGQKMVLYGSGQMTGLGNEAFKTFGGEWLGKTNWKPKPQTEFTNAFNLQGTERWDTPEELTPSRVNWPPSFIDYFLYHHNRLLANVPINGTWWDNVSISTVRDYDPEQEEFYKRFNVFSRRELMKRLNNIGWENNRRPWWVSNLHVDWSFNQVAWHIENDFYTSNEDTTMVEQLPVDQFRALTRIKRGIIHRLATRGPKGTHEQIRKVGRNAVGMCLLHDIGAYNWGSVAEYQHGLLDILDEKVGFFADAEFVPYWDNSDLLTIEEKGVYASIYRGNGKAVIVLLSSLRGGADIHLNLNPKNILKGGKINRVYDPEEDRTMRVRNIPETKMTQVYEMKKYTLGIEDRGVRLIVVE